MVTVGPGPPEHSWERAGPWVARKSMSSSVTFQLRTRWLGPEAGGVDEAASVPVVGTEGQRVAEDSRSPELQ